MKKISIFLIVFSLTASLAYSQRQAPILIAAGQSNNAPFFQNERSQITENIAPQRGEVINIIMAQLYTERPVYVNYRVLQEADSAELEYLKRVCPITLDMVEQLDLKVVIKGIDPRAHSLDRNLEPRNDRFWIPEQQDLAWQLSGFASRYKPVDKTIEEIKAIEGGAEWLLLTMVLINQDLKLEEELARYIHKQYSFKTVVLADIYWLRPYQKFLTVKNVGFGKSMQDARFNWVHHMKKKLGVIK